mmetsp:Transcript_138218/g.440956  ORF Transcript_138218/g.440956 Transcript_138218/m.440956 type:complete len:203 (+) Transcript_138218:404-1012(+)
MDLLSSSTLAALQTQPLQVATLHVGLREGCRGAYSCWAVQLALSRRMSSVQVDLPTLRFPSSPMAHRAFADSSAPSVVRTGRGHHLHFSTSFTSMVAKIRLPRTWSAVITMMILRVQSCHQERVFSVVAAILAWVDIIEPSLCRVRVGSAAPMSRRVAFRSIIGLSASVSCDDSAFPAARLAVKDCFLEGVGDLIDAEDRDK